MSAPKAPHPALLPLIRILAEQAVREHLASDCETQPPRALREKRPNRVIPKQVGNA